MKQYRCTEDCYPFVKDEIYQGIKVFISVFGDKFPVYQIFYGDGMNDFITMPCDKFEEVND